MYKFTNGLVFFTKEDADKAIASGYHLIEEEKAGNVDNEDKTRIIGEFSKNTQQQLTKLKKAINEGSESFVKQATKRMYELVVANCNDKNISNASSRINYEYDDGKNVGKVFTDDQVVIFNEFGTGIKGEQGSEWAQAFDYTVNESGKGESGWWYPTTADDPNPYKWRDKDGQLRALTHGLESRHMFYDAYQQVLNEFDKLVQTTILKQIGEMYEKGTRNS